MKLVVASLFGTLVAGSALAQAQQCRVPQHIERPRPDLPNADQPKRVIPTGGYTLALTWSPGFCRVHGSDPDNRFQCAGDNRFGFTLHGLWPDGVGRTWPQYCKRTTLLSAAEIRKNLCATPSVQLLQHEWAKHGTCMPDTPATYFAKARRLYDPIRYPDMDALSRRTLTVAQFKQAFNAANPDNPEKSIKVTLSRQGWLDELWLCLDTKLRYTLCKPNSGGAPDGALVKIWRGDTGPR